MTTLLAQVSAAQTWRPALTELSEFAGVAGATVAVAHWVIKKGESWVGRVVDDRRKARVGDTVPPMPISSCKVESLSEILAESVSVQRETAKNIASLSVVVERSTAALDLRHAEVKGDLKVLLDRDRR